MKKDRIKVVLAYILKVLEMRNTCCVSLYLCHIVYDLYMDDTISYHEYEEIKEYIIKNRPKFGSKLMDKDLRKSYRRAKMTAKEYNDEKFKPDVIWERGNYIQRKMWLQLHIKKNS